MLDQTGVRVGPEPPVLLEEEKGVDEQLGVNVQDRVEPVVLGGPSDTEVGGGEHASSIRDRVGDELADGRSQRPAT